MSNSFNPEDLTKEKSLWDIYHNAKRIKFSRFNKYIMAIAILAISARSLYLSKDIGVLLQETRRWAEIGFNSSVSILGFLIAGFTIFATLTKPSMLLKMMEFKHKETDLPYLKYNFFCFMRVFVYYIIFIIVYLSVMLFGATDGLFESFVNFLPYSEYIRIFSIKIGNVIVGSSLLFLLLQLKTFIYNIYSIVMNSLRWEYHDQ